MNEKYDLIKVFACDHRNTDDWNLPFIRVGTGFNCKSAIKDTIEESICTKENDRLYSEGTALYWVWKHLKDFGNAQYVGFCHYRRFFTILLKPNYGIFPIHLAKNMLNENVLKNIVSPLQQYALIQKFNVDGILPTSFYDIAYIKGCKSISDVMKCESDQKDIQLNMPTFLCNKAFEILSNAVKLEYKQNMIKTFSDLKTYHFNVFTLKNELFYQYCEIMFNACAKLIDFAKENNIENLHPRWIAYVMERYSSCIFKMMALNGHKFLELTMLTLSQKAEYKV